MIFELVQDIADATAEMPLEHPRRRILKLLNESLHREIHFIARHREDYPQALFQCLWNNAWWYDCEEAPLHYEAPEGGWTPENAPWLREESCKLSRLTARWRRDFDSQGGLPWLRSLRPPAVHLGSAMKLVFRGHEDSVNTVSFSPDGQTIASGSDDNTVRIWDVESGAELRLLRGHAGKVTGVAFSPDGGRIASGSYDRTIRIWDVNSGAELSVFRSETEIAGGLSFLPDARRILSGSSDRTLLLSIESDLAIRVIRSFDGGSSVALSRDGRKIASGGSDKTIRVWDAETEEVLGILRGHEGDVMSVSISSDGNWIASGSTDWTVRVWNSNGGAEFRDLIHPPGYISSVSFSPDGDRVVSGASNAVVRIWQTSDGKELRVLRGHEERITSVVFSPDGRWIASGSTDRTIRLWDSDNDSEARLLRGDESPVDTVSFSVNGRHVITTSSTWYMSMWDVDTGVLHSCTRSHEALQFLSSSDYPYPRGLETLIRGTASTTPIAWFPNIIQHAVWHPAVNTLAGREGGSHLTLFRLMGSAPETVRIDKN